VGFVVRVRFAGTEHGPPSWVEALACWDSGIWVNRSSSSFAAKLKTGRRDSPVAVPTFQGTTGDRENRALRVRLSAAHLEGR